MPGTWIVVPSSTLLEWWPVYHGARRVLPFLLSSFIDVLRSLLQTAFAKEARVLLVVVARQCSKSRGLRGEEGRRHSGTYSALCRYFERFAPPDKRRRVGKWNGAHLRNSLDKHAARRRRGAQRAALLRSLPSPLRGRIVHQVSDIRYTFLSNKCISISEHFYQ